jgi:hypothetical protein
MEIGSPDQAPGPVWHVARSGPIRIRTWPPGVERKMMVPVDYEVANPAAPWIILGLVLLAVAAVVFWRMWKLRERSHELPKDPPSDRES